MDYLATCSSGLLKQINEDGVLISHMESLSWSFFQQTSYNGSLISPTLPSEAFFSGVERQTKIPVVHFTKFLYTWTTKISSFPKHSRNDFLVCYKSSSGVGKLLLQSNVKIFLGKSIIIFKINYKSGYWCCSSKKA